MKAAGIIIIVGLALLYILDSAFKIYNINVEMLIHNLVRFIIGFVILGVWVLNKKKLKLKLSIYIILVLLLADDIYDYTRNIDSLTVGMILHDIFMLLWGTLTGFFFYKDFGKDETDEL